MAEFGFSDDHAGIKADEYRKAQLEAEYKWPCKRCEGTGNELYAMYRRCQDCGGSGEAHNQILELPLRNR
jgi:DnaJ-class molecular chaperone